MKGKRKPEAVTIPGAEFLPDVIVTRNFEPEDIRMAVDQAQQHSNNPKDAYSQKIEACIQFADEMKALATVKAKITETSFWRPRPKRHKGWWQLWDDAMVVLADAHELRSLIDRGAWHYAINRAMGLGEKAMLLNVRYEMLVRIRGAGGKKIGVKQSEEKTKRVKRTKERAADFESAGRELSNSEDLQMLTAQVNRNSKRPVKPSTVKSYIPRKK